MMIRRLRLAAALACATAMPFAVSAQPTDGLSGAYLAARTAAIHNDYAAAADYYTKALLRDPKNPLLLEYALVGQVSLGRFDAGLPLAKRLGEIGVDSRIGRVVEMTDRIGRKAWDELIASLATEQVSPVVDGLAAAWAQVGAGRMSDAIAAFDKMAATEQLRFIALDNKAMALASVGDFEGAETIYAGEEKDGRFRMTRRAAIARAQILSQIDRAPDAVAMLEEVFGADPDPEVTALRNRLAKGEAVPFGIVRNPVDGMAEVFYGVSAALTGEAAEGYTLIYARMAQHLRPDHTDAMLLAADMLESQGQFDLAIAEYKRIPKDNPAFYIAEMGRAEALRDGGDPKAAIEVLTQLAKSHPDMPIVHLRLADTLRMEDRFAEAAKAYDRTIALLPNPGPGQWSLFFSRGIAHERSAQWPKAEADFRKALELNPDHPAVLNYLGYSYVDRGERLEEALDMIGRALEADPDNGAITDSLGWAYYRLGRYQDAVEPMERAVELEAVDPVVNDHLGDVYWAVGRKLEAEFQWRRALSFGPEEKEAARIRRKLDVGLDAVLKEEGAKPIPRTNGG